LIYEYYSAEHVGPCHYGMARLQVADGGTPSNMEGSCECIEYAVADSRQGVVFRLGVWAKRLQIFTVKMTVLRNIHSCLGLGMILK